MEPGCAMGIAREATDRADRGAGQALCLQPCPGNHPCWGGQNDMASAGVCLSEADTPVGPSLDSCLRVREWPAQPSPGGCCRKRGPDAAEGEPPPKQAKMPATEEAGLPEALEALPPSAPPEEVSAAGPAPQKRPRGRKPKKRARVHQGPTPPEPGGGGEVAGPSENGPSLPAKVPKKRGRKSKAELLLLKLSQGLDCPAPEPRCLPKGLASSSEELETTPGGRPQRRAAKVALLYLQELAEELTSACQASPCEEEEEEEEEGALGGPPLELEEPRPKRRGRRPHGQKLERQQAEEEDADFIPSEEGLLEAEEEEEEEDDDEEEEEGAAGSGLLAGEASDPEQERSLCGVVRAKGQCRGFASNGLPNSIMAPVWRSLAITHQLREQFHSSWEFPEWVPSAWQWAFLSESEADGYLPSEARSPLFSIQREGLQEEPGVLSRLDRFDALQPHEERLDVTFFVGGPVWAMEWCPTPEGAVASQYVAIYCHSGMEAWHSLAGTHAGPALLQLWELGALQQDAGPAAKPGLAYAIATGHGCIWDMKFCPSGAWEPPATRRQPPQMSRLGLLATACSDGKVLLYSLPHAEALRACRRAQVTGGPSSRHTICKVQCVASLQVGSVQAGSFSECGQCFSVAWMPTKPHQHLAAGFYDGTVALWNLPSKSLLQRVRQPDGSLKLYPFRCFPAHDHTVRNIQWCKANSNFLVTAGNDRKIKFWDLRRPHEPLNSIKRFLSTETAWLLPYSGITVAQDNCYASYGLCGIHYLDAGYLGFRAYFVAPRKGTVWSISGSDWLNTVAAGDVTGELVAAMMPDLSADPHNVKRPSERRFPVYKADLLPCVPVGQEAAAAAGGGGEKPQAEGRTYSDSAARNYLLFQDTDLRSFKKARKRTPMQEVKEGEGLGRLQLEAVHKVRFSPNLGCLSWLASGGQAGLVRLHCLRALTSPPSRKLQLQCQVQCSALREAEGQAGPAVR
ncbi:general transcription factor 3C polypeptide 2 [Hemicordylus capensis]|uniref:general transcription factor 3C polypeptide 2 n=1 Tax=Hemicordylus capensis TaxID=884348 RepID=UPI0023032A7D|nr:general transcription factor 3C polypeptide 2 [Hemicordylus capensis]